MELKIKQITFPEVIEFNFDELKKEITDRVELYRNLVYTEDQVKQAKADRANLNKFVKALSDERIKVKKQCLQPYEAFEAKVNELSKIVQEPIRLIDEQVKAYEEKQKQDKLKAIQDLWCSLEVTDGRLTFKMIFNEKWLNASVSMKSVQAEMEERIKKFNDDMATLANLPEFGFEAQEIYISTLDINKAISEGHRLSEIAKKKAEHEAEQARLKAEDEARKAAFPDDAMNPPVEPESDMGKVISGIDRQAFENAVNPAPAKQWIAFQALMTTEDALALKAFFELRNIEFKPV